MAVHGPRKLEHRKTNRGDLVDGRDLSRLVLADTCPFLIKIDVERFKPIVIDQILQTVFTDRISAFP